MSSINGLRELVGTSITCTGEINLGTNLNPGTAGQVIVSQGDELPAIWSSSEAENIPSNFFKDNTTNKYYRFIHPIELMGDRGHTLINFAGNISRGVAPVSPGQLGAYQQAGNSGATTSGFFYFMFEIPIGFKWVRYRLNLLDNTNTEIGLTAAAATYTRAGVKQISTAISYITPTATGIFNSDEVVPDTTSGYSNTWTISDIYNFGVVEGHFNFNGLQYCGGGWIEFEKL